MKPWLKQRAAAVMDSVEAAPPSTAQLLSQPVSNRLRQLLFFLLKAFAVAANLKAG